MAADSNHYRTADLNLPLRLPLAASSRNRPRILSSEAPNPPPIGNLGDDDLRPRIPSSEAPNTPPIDKLGDDLLVEILIRSFPNPKPACRCKTVCKRWSSLISSPHFNRSFVSHHQIMSLRHQPPKPDNQSELEMIILSFLPPMPNRVGYVLKVFDCFKDLVLCGFWDRYRENEEHGRSYLICNPFMKQWIALPLAPRKPEWHSSSTAKLVCESRISKNLDIGGDQAFVYHEYRFRVVCMYHDIEANSCKLDVFCSESGEWIRHGGPGFGTSIHGALSCNGELLWMRHAKCKRVTVFNPFRLDIPPTCIHTRSAFFAEDVRVASVSQDAPHVISFHSHTEPLRVTSWRLEQDRKSWRKQCEWFVKSIRCCSEPYTWLSNPFLHPHNPEIIFFLCIGCQNTLLSFNSRMEGKVEIFRKLKDWDADNCPVSVTVRVFEPRVSCWLTPIPRYNELRGLYDGSHNLWVQGGSEATPIGSRDRGCVAESHTEAANNLDAVRQHNLIIAAQEKIECFGKGKGRVGGEAETSQKEILGV